LQGCRWRTTDFYKEAMVDMLTNDLYQMKKNLDNVRASSQSLYVK